LEQPASNDRNKAAIRKRNTVKFRMAKRFSLEMVIALPQGAPPQAVQPTRRSSICH
jgi:hypothetical protein